VELIVPQSLPEQPVPLTDQVTAGFEVPVTVAVNCCVPPITTLAVAGEMPTVTGISVTVAEADRVGSTTDVAFTVAVVWFVTTAGAV
jgi:hypothetical protein